jgi:deoxyribodipyrimidine photo-lyase
VRRQFVGHGLVAAFAAHDDQDRAVWHDEELFVLERDLDRRLAEEKCVVADRDLHRHVARGAEALLPRLLLVLRRRQRLARADRHDAAGADFFLLDHASGQVEADLGLALLLLGLHEHPVTDDEQFFLAALHGRAKDTRGEGGCIRLRRSDEALRMAYSGSRSPSVVPSVRLRVRNDEPVRPERDFVLYWMVAARRTTANFGLQRAAELARETGKPLFVLEALRCDYRWASDRFHAFVLPGMADNKAACEAAGVTYHAYVEPESGAGRGLLAALGERAVAVVSDDYPCFFVPRMQAAAARQLDVRFEVVDGNGLLPMRVADKEFKRAFDLRRFLQQALPAHLRDVPMAEPLRQDGLAGAVLPRAVSSGWPAASADLLDADPSALAALPIDHEVGVVDLRGGAAAGQRRLEQFVATRLADYGEKRSHPDDDAASGLSPYLHFGHVGAHEAFAAVAAHEGWTPSKLRAIKSGQRGWFGMGDSAEAFLDELITWRELAFNTALHRERHDDYDALPDWARATLAEHAGDVREHLYSIDQFAASRTHDEVWNAAQSQLRETGVLQNYLRMLWGKKVLEWTPLPQHAMQVLIELNNRYALDGRDPNSYAGIFWIFGQYDRPWAPERDVFGTIRFMSSTNTVRKLRMKRYLETW